MYIGEYENIYQHEANHWWYKSLHHLVMLFIHKHRRQLADSGKNETVGFDILDAGCGTGRMMELMQKYGQVEGIDYSDAAIAFTRSRGLIGGVKADLNSWEPAKKYDIIVTLDVLYHKGIADDMAIVEKFNRALNPGGLLVINLPAFESLRRWHDEVVHTRKRYRRDFFCRQLESKGFKIRKATYRLPHLYFIILLSKFFSNRKANSEARSDLLQVHPLINALLLAAGKLENQWISKIGNMPVGSSLFVVAYKN